MSLFKKSRKRWRKFTLPVSYRLGETRDDRLIDALNVYSNQDRLETRHGMGKYNSTTLGGEILSVSFFKKTDGTRYILAKVGSVLYSVSASGSHTSIKTGLTSTTKHRGITLNNRHIIAIGNDGLFSYDGTTFTQLGQDPPSAPTVAAAAGGDVTADTYEVALTFYASGTGFETNAGAASSQVVTSGTDLTISVSGIPTTADNGTIDKVRVYLKNVTDSGEYLFSQEINLGTSTASIDEIPTSSSTPPTTAAKPQSGGGKYMTEFNRRLVYTGNNSFKNDVFFSEQDIPDGFDDDGDTQLVLNLTGDGDATGVATGFYNQDSLEPYLAIFKKNSTHIYSEKSGFSRLVMISNKIGCVSHDTIQVVNGNIGFLSESGWRLISNGRLLENEDGNPATLGFGDIDDIFKSKGYVYELNKAQMANYFSVFYAELNQYITWIAEGSNSAKTKAYVYEIESQGFKPYQFAVPATCAATAEDASGNEIVLFGDSNGWLYKHSIQQDRTDIDASDAAVNIEAFALMAWLDGDDMNHTYNFRELILRAITSENDLTVKAFLDFNIQDLQDYTYEFPDPVSGFVLDVSALDEGVFSDARTIVTTRADINRVGESLLIGFYQTAENGNLNLIAAQLEMNKNGNCN